MTEIATFAGGCFWCTEAVFDQLAGVEAVTSGYAGGDVADPSYEAVCTGETGHAECVQVEFDPDVVSYEDLCRVFFATHDPTQLNRQGPDVGSQYRSAVFYHDDAQRETVEDVLADLEPHYDEEIVTEVEPLETFYAAEEKHQDYFAKHPTQGYCRVQVAPKVDKTRDRFGELVEE